MSRLQLFNLSRPLFNQGPPINQWWLPPGARSRFRFTNADRRRRYLDAFEAFTGDGPVEVRPEL